MPLYVSDYKSLWHPIKITMLSFNENYLPSYSFTLFWISSKSLTLMFAKVLRVVRCILNNILYRLSRLQTF